MRVAAIVEQCWHKIPGGTATATVGTLQALATREDIELVGLSASHRRLPYVAVPASLPVISVPLPRRVLYDAWHHLRFPSISSFVGEVDVVHSTGGVVPPSKGAALVVTIHDLFFLRRPEWFTKRGARFAVKAFQLAKAESVLVTVPSQSTAEDCIAEGISSNRIHVVPWGVDMPLAAPDDIQVVRKRYQLPETFILWVGTVEPRKNLGGLLSAVSKTENKVPLVLAGPSGWGLQLGKLVDTYPVDVIRIGYVADRRDLAALYAAARVFVYPSLMEGFGLPVLEAMSQGTPVITSSGTATEEVCADAASVVDPTDSEALAAAIDFIITDSVEHARRAATAKARASELTWEATAEQVYSAYLQACQ